MPVFGESILPEEYISLIEQVSETHGTLTALMEAANIDVRVDLRHSDLRFVNFSGVNFQGFDLSGADLRGAFGFNTQNLDKAVLHDALVEGSIFQYTNHLRGIRGEHPEIELEATQLLNQDWHRQIEWISGAVKSVNGGNRIKKYVAQQLLENTDDLSVRKQLMLYLEDFFSDAAELTAYIRHMLATKPLEHPIFEQAALLYSYDYMAGDDAVEVLTALLPHPEFNVRRYALLGLSQNNRLTALQRSRIGRFVSGPEFKLYRQELLLRNAVLLGHAANTAENVISAQNISNTRDFLEPLCPSEDEAIAHSRNYWTKIAVDHDKIASQANRSRLEEMLLDLKERCNITFQAPATSWVFRLYKQTENRRPQHISIRAANRKSIQWRPPATNMAQNPIPSHSPEYQLNVSIGAIGEVLKQAMDPSD